MSVFAVLLVCEGNQCRSPAAEHILRTQLAAAPGQLSAFELMSAGTRASEGMPVHPLTARAMQDAGLTVPVHSSTRVIPDAVASADLILTADRAQRTMVAALADNVAGRTFTLLEFAGLGVEILTQEGTLPPPTLVATAAAGRGPSWNDPRHDLPDPISGDAGKHVAVLDQVIQASLAVAHVLSAEER